jgi:hypothetical protein
MDQMRKPAVTSAHSSARSAGRNFVRFALDDQHFAVPPLQAGGDGLDQTAEL